MPKTLATATVDRLLHRAHLCVTAGDSVRLAEATAGDDVVPLTSSPASPRPGRRRSGLRRDVPASVSSPEVTPIELD
jgi:hypothetical protein